MTNSTKILDYAHAFIVRRLLPIGVIVLLTGLFWAKDGSQYTKFYYGLLAAPALLAALFRYRELRAIAAEPMVRTYLLLFAWIALSLTWSTTDNDNGSLLKRPLYVLMLLVAFTLVALHDSKLLMQSLRIGAGIGALAALYNLIDFYLAGMPGGRLIGTGALHNPLLTSHLLGFLCCYWLASWLSANERHGAVPIVCALVLLGALLATGSRTPLLALALTCVWMIAISGKRAVYLLALMCAAAAALIVFWPEAILSRGLSHRPELWADAIRQTQGQLWLGGGYDSDYLFNISAVSGLSDPHNVQLAVLLELGLVGLVIWLGMYALALWQTYKYRTEADFQIASALIIYGIGAGLTEGGNFLSRPNESWFMVWIPLAICCALAVSKRQSK
ncbi:O-antigen ligase family protein [Stutzerimonas nitrititolerans]|uniref:O-antigen ligase family protein n=1 Tax=Stutzerimonas nitrititolerans TaxID=2482751 RepID=UPI0028A2A4A6|nr:O-antigen ligase family protein [Stutzerimonas nitrititolerans]